MRGILLALTRHRGLPMATGFRAFRSGLAKGLPEASGKRVVLDPPLRAETRRFGSIPVNHESRRVGRSNYGLPMLMRFAFTEIATDLRWVRRNTEPEPGVDGRH